MSLPLRSTLPDLEREAPEVWEAPARPALRPERVSPERAVEWEEFAPRSWYARLGRPLLRVVLLVLSLPLALALSLPIALVNALQFGGPRRVFFRQRRVGLHGRVFWILKFRTMHGDDGDCDAWRAGEDQERVTRFGNFLRRTHLDELPQLWNILRGEMDFLGPRPEMLAIDEWARNRIPRFRARNAVRPGVTGLAQVTQGYAPREEHAYRRKLALDLHAMACLSLALDLEILGRTALWMLRGRGWRSGCPAPQRGRA